MRHVELKHTHSEQFHKGTVLASNLNDTWVGIPVLWYLPPTKDTSHFKKIDKFKLGAQRDSKKSQVTFTACIVTLMAWTPLVTTKR